MRTQTNKIYNFVDKSLRRTVPEILRAFGRQHRISHTSVFIEFGHVWDAFLHRSRSESPSAEFIHSELSINHLFHFIMAELQKRTLPNWKLEVLGIPLDSPVEVPQQQQQQQQSRKRPLISDKEKEEMEEEEELEQESLQQMVIPSSNPSSPQKNMQRSQNDPKHIHVFDTDQLYPVIDAMMTHISYKARILQYEQSPQFAEDCEESVQKWLSGWIKTDAQPILDNYLEEKKAEELAKAIADADDEKKKLMDAAKKDVDEYRAAEKQKIDDSMTPYKQQLQIDVATAVVEENEKVQEPVRKKIRINWDLCEQLARDAQNNEGV